MNNDKYLNYLNSNEWKQIANERLRIDNFKCVCCGSSGTNTNPLETHHLSYKSIYNEQNRIYEDLVTLCKSCHTNLHRIMNRKTAPNRNGWSDRKDIPTIYTFHVGHELYHGKC